MTASTSGPDVVIAGAARSGTSALAAQLGLHPNIDPGKIKEPNYFSRQFHQGPSWYESLYEARAEGLLRLDASTSYTSPEFPEALQRLAEASPRALVIYSVRQPTERALSHYLLRHHNMRIERAADFGSALSATTLYEHFSDYDRWLPALTSTFGVHRVLVVPFELLTNSAREVTDEVCRQLQLPALTEAERAGQQLRNEVVQYRSKAARLFAKRVRTSRAYPWVRSKIGAERARNARNLLTHKPRLPSVAEAMSTCSPEQLARLKRLDQRASAAAYEHLLAQDSRLGLSWAGRCFCVSDARSSPTE